MQKPLRIVGAILCLWGAYNIYAGFYYMSLPAGFISGAGNTPENSGILGAGVLITMIGIASLVLSNWLGKTQGHVTQFSH